MKTIEGLLELVRVKTRSWVDPEITVYAHELVEQVPHALKEKLRSAEARIAELEADAARYRWLQREADRYPIKTASGRALTKFIDAAMQKEKHDRHL